MKKCVFCGKQFEPGLRSDGFPTGIEVNTYDGETDEFAGKESVCGDCLIDILKAMDAYDTLSKEDKEKLKKWL